MPIHPRIRFHCSAAYRLNASRLLKKHDDQLGTTHHKSFLTPNKTPTIDLPSVNPKYHQTKSHARDNVCEKPASSLQSFSRLEPGENKATKVIQSKHRKPQDGQLPRLNLRHRAGQGELLILLQDRSLPPRRPVQQKAREAVILADHSHAKLVPKPGLRPQEPHEPAAAAEPLRRLLRGHLVRDVQVRRARGACRVRQ